MSNLEVCAQHLVNDPTNYTIAEDFVLELCDSSGLFRAQEDDLFDYKREYPHSMTDGYFAGICRIIFGFHNSFGGILVLGVHDLKRTGGHNKKFVNVERLNTRLRELSGVSINVRHLDLNYLGDNEGEQAKRVDLLVIPKRLPNAPPVALLSKLEKYAAGTVWIRRGHEVLEVTSRDTAFLFGPRDMVSDPDLYKVPGYLPTRPSTIASFVGRVGTLSKLFSWISSEDEPRKFLWGRGGSGKSTIAFEFAQLVKDCGKSIEGYDGETFERVVFLSAKERELNSEKGRIQDTMHVDFSTFSQLLIAFLVAADYSVDEDYSSMSIEELAMRVKELFDFENMLVVIDDIDTLVTKGEDAGFDLLYKLALRAKKCIRILYTQRNQPLSSENSIEVSGFEKEEEFVEFVHKCCDQFKVPMPKEDFMHSYLWKDTEGIPLIIETIVGLRKTCGDFQKAHQIFLDRRGDESRKYLFEREYDALGRDNKGRQVLATISEFGRPISNDEILAIVQFGESSVSEAIGEVLGFFLSTSTSAEGATNYYLNPVTKAFIREKSKTLDFSTALVERVKNFKSAGRRKTQEVALVETKIQRLLDIGQIDPALDMVCREVTPSIVENAAFRMLRAQIFSICSPVRRAEAREDFQYCVDHSYEDAEGMRKWLAMEREAGSSHNQERICDYVINGKAYAEKVKHEFNSRKATVLYFKGRDHGVSSADGFGLFERSLFLSVRAFNFFHGTGADTNFNYRYVRSTAFSLVNSAKALDYDRQLVKVFEGIQKEHGFLCDPLFEPFAEMLRYFAMSRGGEIGKRRQGIIRSVNARIGKSITFELPEFNQKCAKLSEA
ncbi:RNA-binding domain-containing protein [Sulfitobacter mediterraneus]|uniref:RNA-binding domain-containing protein n=1 Tax=Sulfitobacter mediterraneus TaxID=83219 RepID=UPI0024936A51|nr:RNA-binding domain-containing protein [Sulfitobacter mediterraneus]